MAKDCPVMESFWVRLWLRIVQSWKVCRSDYGYGLYSQGKYEVLIMAKDNPVMESL